METPEKDFIVTAFRIKSLFRELDNEMTKGSKLPLQWTASRLWY